MTDTKPQNGNDQQAWDAPQYEAALAHLEKLQEQVRAFHQRFHIEQYLKLPQLAALRSAIPSVVAPMMQANTSKSQLFADIKTAAVTSTTELKDFRDNWTSEQTQSLLAKSNESKQKDGDLSKAASVPRYGWCDGD